MRYCRFLLDDRIHYGTVEEHGGRAMDYRTGAHAPEDLALRLALGSPSQAAANLSRCR